MSESPDPITSVQAIPVAAILPSARNPRQVLKGLDELAASIGEYGLLQPIVVRRGEQGYEVVAGHRRLAAVQKLGWTEVPAITREADDDEAYLLTLVENLQRDDLTNREESNALEVLVRERGWSTRQVAAAIKRSQAYVSKRLRVFEDPDLAPLVLQNRLPVSVAEELLPARPRVRKLLLERAVSEKWDGATARNAVRPGRERRSAGRRQPATSLLQAMRTTRGLLKNTFPEDLDDAQRREMRLLFLDLSLFARAPLEKRDVVLPPLPLQRARG